LRERMIGYQANEEMYVIRHENVTPDAGTMLDALRAKIAERPMYPVIGQDRPAIAGRERHKEQRCLVGLKDLQPGRSVGHRRRHIL
jgi:hypothetical protein